MKKLALSLAFALALGARPAAAQGDYVIIVNPGNPIAALPAAKVSQLFLGKLQAWDINGRIEPVSAVDLKPDSEVRARFTQRVHRRTVTAVESYWRQEVYAGRNVPPPQETEDSAVAHVRSSRGGIAYVSAKADLRGVKILRVQ